MTVNEIVDELGAARPRASDALRLQVLTHASVPPTRRPSLGERVRGRRRTMLALPVAAGLAVAAAVAVGITQSSPAPVAREAVSSPSQDTAVRSVGAQPPAALAGPQVGSATSRSKAPAPAIGRAQRYTATLTLGVDDTDALSSATQQALAIARDLGGYVVSVQYATGESGVASLTLRVPSTQAATAVTRLSDLGTILAQNVQIDDLQESLDALGREIERARAQIAALTAAIDRAETPAQRARLVERRGRGSSPAARADRDPFGDVRSGPERDDPARAPDRRVVGCAGRRVTPRPRTRPGARRARLGGRRRARDRRRSRAPRARRARPVVRTPHQAAARRRPAARRILRGAAGRSARATGPARDPSTRGRRGASPPRA